MGSSLQKLALLVAASSSTLAACGHEPTATSNAPFEARLDGQAFVATHTDFATFSHGTNLAITGGRQTDVGWRVVAFQLANWAGPGTYTLNTIDSTGGAIGFVYDTGPNDSLLAMWTTTTAVTGQAVVTEFDPANRNVKGTFRFEARDSTGGSMSITQGSFTGRYFIDP
jgi:uncharacterized protein DUF6252